MHTGLAVITGTEDRQHAYVALTRGTDANLAYVFTVSPKRADPVPGPRPGRAGARRPDSCRGPPGRPGYVIVVDQLDDWPPDQPPSLAELLETRPARTREPEPDLEAEP